MLARGFMCVFAFLTLVGPRPLAAASIVHLYGAPGSLEGRFEDMNGDIDLQGWLGVECLEVGTQFLWQTSDFNAENLNDNGIGNHAMWAGRTAAQRPTWVNPPGYGDYWNTVVQWSHPAPTLIAPFEVELSAVYNKDIETSYDFVHVEWNQAGVWQTLELIDGNSEAGALGFLPPGVALLQQWTVQPADLVDGELQIRLRVTSDGAVSDELGVLLFADTDGAIQIDDIAVSFDGVPVDGGGDADGVASFEGGDDEGWTPQPDTCGCTVVSELANDSDPAPDNLTPQLGHFTSSLYPGTQSGRCTFESPVIQWDIPTAQGLDGTLLRFRSLRDHSGNLGGWNARVRARTDGEWGIFAVAGSVNDPADLWRSYDFDLTPLIPAGTDLIQIRIVTGRGNDVELRQSFDDIQVMRYDTSLTPAPPSTPLAGLELAVYPNPTNPSASIRYSLSAAGPVRLELFDARGRRVRTLVDGVEDAGSHVARFDGVDERGRSVVSGVYFVRLRADQQERSERIILVR